MDPFCYIFFMFLFVMVSCLFLAALGSSARNLLCVVFSCDSVTFPYGVQGQVWYLIVSIPPLYYRHYSIIKNKYSYNDSNNKKHRL